MAPRLNLSGFRFAHRGLWDANRPENALSAFRAASAHGFGAECDVHLSSDGVPMVFHDFDLVRMTGHSARLHDLDCQTLSSLSLNGTDETIPTLQAVLDEMSGAPLLVELKAKRGTDIAALAAGTLAVVSGNDNLALMSFSTDLLREIRRLESDVMLGWLIEPGQMPAAEEAESFVRTQKIGFLGPNIKDLLPVSAMAKSLRIQTACWTIRNMDDLSQCFAAQAAPIFEKLNPALVRGTLKH